MGRIGLCLTGQCDSIDRYVEGARYAEERGHDVVWFDEDYFFRDSLTIASAVGHDTDAVDVGVLVNPYSRHPVLTALSVASLDDIAGGDVMVGMGAGFPDFMEQFVDYEDPLWTTKQAITLMRELVAGGSVTYSQGQFDVESVTLGECSALPFMGSFDPPREEIPVHVAAIQPEMLKMAGDIGDGWIVSFGSSPEYIAGAFDHVQEGLAMSGRPREDFDVTAFIIADGSQSERARRFTAFNVGAFQPLNVVIASGIDEADGRAVQEAFSEGGPDAAVEHVTEEMVETYVITPENETPPAERLSEFIDVGVDVPVLFPIDASNYEAVIEMGAEWVNGSTGNSKR